MLEAVLPFAFVPISILPSVDSVSMCFALMPNSEWEREFTIRPCMSPLLWSSKCLGPASCPSPTLHCRFHPWPRCKCLFHELFHLWTIGVMGCCLLGLHRCCHWCIVRSLIHCVCHASKSHRKVCHSRTALFLFRLWTLQWVDYLSLPLSSPLYSAFLYIFMCVSIEHKQSTMYVGNKPRIYNRCAHLLTTMPSGSAFSGI